MAAPFLAEPFASAWGDDPFAAAQAQQGEVFRDKEGRRTLRFEQNGEAFFLKLHQGIGWGEILKNLLQLRLPVLGAANEYHAIRALEQLGIGTMEAVAFGVRGCNPARQLSFLVTRELAPTISLEDFCRDWGQQPPAPALRLALLYRLAAITRTLLGNGINHRDYYLCHFLLDTREPATPQHLPLHLIDLHRAQIRRRTPTRWAVKDLAGLFYSAMDCGLRQRDLLRFIRRFSARPLRQELQQQAAFWRAVQQRAEKLYRKDHGREPPRIDW